MLTIGCHLSCSKGYEHMAREAVELGGNTFQFFTRNPRGCKAKEIDEGDVQAFHAFCADNGIERILAHAPYTLNPASAKPEVREFARMVLADDLLRMENTPHQMYNMHPGSHVGQGVDAGIELICETLNEVLQPEQTTTLLLETMAGKGSEIGRTFEELRTIIERLELEHHVGVCLDTCHIWDGGYNVQDMDEVLEQFDHILGIERLKALHLNDSKNALGSHKDRHEQIGAGCIGLEAFQRIVTHPQLKDLPMFLETPHDSAAGFAKEISLLRGFAEACLG